MEKKTTVYHHILFWTIFSLSFAISQWAYNNTFAKAFFYEVVMMPARMLAVYINWFYLAPRFLYRRKIKEYILLLCVVVVGVALLNRAFALYIVFPEYFPEFVFRNEVQTYIENGITKEKTVQVFYSPFWVLYRVMQYILLILTPVLYTTGWKVFRDWLGERKRSLQLQQEKTDTELKFLRAQVNPHFLFNTLNNIYGLAREGSEKVPGQILKLSDILSFTLYDSGVEKIKLEKELMLIENLVSLEKDRYGDRAVVEMDIQRPDPNLEISPLLLVPLVENAFKHGIRNELEKAWVKISSVIEGTNFTFRVENSVAERELVNNDKSGLGIENLQRRLELLYPDRHRLQLSGNGNVFKATLYLNLAP